jgi:hypothetical protein
LCCFKVDTVLGPVDFVFRPIPFNPHVYLQYSPYDCVKSSGRRLSKSGPSAQALSFSRIASSISARCDRA